MAGRKDGMKKIVIPGAKCKTTLNKVCCYTENGISRAVTVDGQQIKGAQSVRVHYGVDAKPQININFIADSVEIIEIENEELDPAVNGSLDDWTKGEA